MDDISLVVLLVASDKEHFVCAVCCKETAQGDGLLLCPQCLQTPPPRIGLGMTTPFRDCNWRVCKGKHVNRHRCACLTQPAATWVSAVAGMCSGGIHTALVSSTNSHKGCVPLGNQLNSWNASLISDTIGLCMCNGAEPSALRWRFMDGVSPTKHCVCQRHLTRCAASICTHV